MKNSDSNKIQEALNQFEIELPSWGFADTGTRFGKFYQEAAAVDIQDKFEDAGKVHHLTGCCPTVAVHVLWDFLPEQDPKEVQKLAKAHDIDIGSINPNLFQDQIYKSGSFGHPDSTVRQSALNHVHDCIKLGQSLDSRYLALWFADGTNYPGQDNIRERKKRFTECLKETHKALDKDQIMLVEYKPFEPAFYQTDLADWGMSYALSQKAGPQAKVLVDTGHHYPSQNIEQIVAFLLDEKMLGGFHFNDRRYADDDLTLGSIDPYQIFRIFHEIHSYAFDTETYPEIAYMIDQSHNVKPKMEAMIQTVMTAQELYAKAALVNHEALRKFQSKQDITQAEECLKAAFNTDVTPALTEWRKSKGLSENPLKTLRQENYIAAKGKERTEKRKELGLVQSGSYA